MTCFHVLVHGRLDWGTEQSPAGDAGGTRPQGFYAHRYVLASNEDEATELAFRRVRDNLDKQTGWIERGIAALTLEAEEVAAAPLRKLLKPDNRGTRLLRRRLMSATDRCC